MTIGTKHHAKRIRKLHVRYCLLAMNGIALCGLLTYGFTVRSAQAEANAAKDTAVLHSMMDSIPADNYTLLMPPEVE